MAAISPCSSVVSNRSVNSDYSIEEYSDNDSQEELRNLIFKLDSSMTSDKLYEILLKIRSDYSNTEDSDVPGKYHLHGAMGTFF